MKFLILLISFAQAQTGGFGNNPPVTTGTGFPGGPVPILDGPGSMGSSMTGGIGTGGIGSGGMGSGSMGMGMGMGFFEGLGTCVNNSYAYHPEHGFGYFVKKSKVVHDMSKTYECVFFSLKSHGYPVINRYSATSVQECITGARCERVSGSEGKRVVSIACPPFQMNGQEVVAARDIEKQDSVEILIRSDTPAAIEGQKKRDRREQVVRKSAYVVQTIAKNYLLDSVLSGPKYPVHDLSNNPSEIFSIIDEEKPGIYITSKCNPNDPGPVPVFGPDETGPWGNGGAMGLPGIVDPGPTPTSKGAK